MQLSQIVFFHDCFIQNNYGTSYKIKSDNYMQYQDTGFNYCIALRSLVY